MEEDMRRVTMKRKEVKRLDGMIALPLARFRRALTALTPEELSALEARIALQSVKSRWARGGHGIARHRSTLELDLLARRADETRREREVRRGAVAVPAWSKLLRLRPSWRRRNWKSARPNRALLTTPFSFDRGTMILGLGILVSMSAGLAYPPADFHEVAAMVFSATPQCCSR